MKEIVLLIFLILGIQHNILIAQEDAVLSWAKQIGDGDSTYSSLRSGDFIHIGTDKNIYLAGTFTGTVDFNPSQAIDTLTVIGSTDMFIMKLNAKREFLWVRRIGGVGNESIYDMYLDDKNNIYITGFFTDTVDFDPGPQEHILTEARNGGDMFVQKLDSDGHFLWVSEIEGLLSWETGRAITIDSDYSVYVTGYFHRIIDIDPGPDTNYITSERSLDGLVLKLDSNGKFVWGKHIEGGVDTRMYTIQVDTAKNVYVAGYFRDTVNFDLGERNTTIFSQNQTAFVQKLDTIGRSVWIKYIQGETPSRIHSSCLDVQQRYLYTIGRFTGLINTDPNGSSSIMISNGYYDYFLQKIDVANGQIVWTKQLGGTQNEVIRAFIECDSSSNIYILGNFMGEVDFDMGSGEKYLTSNGGYDIFIQKIDSAGNLIWVKTMGSENNEYAKNIDVGMDNSVYIAAVFEGDIDVDPNRDSLILSIGELFSDMFIQKLIPCFTTHSIDTIEACNIHTWRDSNTYMLSDSTQTHILNNVKGCDSIIRLNLSVHNSKQTVDYVTACSEYMWNNGEYYTASTNAVYDTLHTIYNCDSIVRLDLVINSVNTSLEVDNYTLSVIPNSNATYQWIRCDTTLMLKGDTNHIYQPIYAGKYAVQIREKGCIDTSSCIEISFAGSSIKGQAIIYPNPIINQIHIALFRVYPFIIIRVKNLLGHTVARQEYSNISNITFPFTGTSGIYFLEIDNLQETFVVPIIKQ